MRDEVLRCLITPPFRNNPPVPLGAPTYSHTLPRDTRAQRNTDEGEATALCLREHTDARRPEYAVGIRLSSMKEGGNCGWLCVYVSVCARLRRGTLSRVLQTTEERGASSNYMRAEHASS